MSSAVDLSSGSSCDGLDAAACKQRPDCVADFCEACSCNLDFVGCRAASAPPTSCPGYGCAAPECCRAQSDCSGLSCVKPGDPAGCPVCRTGPVCNSDGDCASQGPNMICDVPWQCACSPNKLCFQGCTSASDCPAGDSCSSSHHCVTTTCANGAGCPANFVCNQTGNGPGQCQRRSCASDRDCPEGFCLGGACYDGLGVCTAPPP